MDLQSYQVRFSSEYGYYLIKDNFKDSMQTVTSGNREWCESYIAEALKHEAKKN